MLIKDKDIHIQILLKNVVKPDRTTFTLLLHVFDAIS